MKRIQFSLLNVICAMALVGACITFSVRWISFGAQPAFEGLLEVIWLAALVLSYCESRHRGWRRIFETTVITGAVWSVGVIATHLMFVSFMRAYGVSIAGLLLRALLVAIIGLAMAFVAASLIQYVASAFRYWRSSAVRSRTWSAAILFVSVLTAAILWNVAQDRVWKPSIVGAIAEPRQYPAAVEKIRSQYNVLMHPCQSSDGRFAAVVDGSILAVHDAATADLVTRLRADRNNRFGTITFLPDGSALLAIQITRENQTSLTAWDTSDWTTRDLTSLTTPTSQRPFSSSFPILLESTLVNVTVEQEQSGNWQITISTTNLSDPELKRTSFASMSVPSITINPLAMMSSGTMPWRWHISRTGTCIVSTGSAFEYGYRWVFRKDALQPLRVSADVLGFAADSDRLVMNENATRLVWKKPGFEGDQPPFWDHWRSDTRNRMLIMDSLSGQVLARSAWWKCQRPHLNIDCTQVTARNQDNVLIWDIPGPTAIADQ